MGAKGLWKAPTSSLMAWKSKWEKQAVTAGNSRPREFSSAVML